MEKALKLAISQVTGCTFTLYWEHDYVIVELGNGRKRDALVGKPVVFSGKCQQKFVLVSRNFAENVFLNPKHADKYFPLDVVIEIGNCFSYDRMVIISELLRFGLLDRLDTSQLSSNESLKSGKIIARYRHQAAYARALHQPIKVNYGGNVFMIKSYEKLVKYHEQFGVIESTVKKYAYDKITTISDKHETSTAALEAEFSRLSMIQEPSKQIRSIQENKEKNDHSEDCSLESYVSFSHPFSLIEYDQLASPTSKDKHHTRAKRYLPYKAKKNNKKSESAKPPVVKHRHYFRKPHSKNYPDDFYG